MHRHVAVVATTGKLANGFQHSHEDLEALAEGLRNRIATDPFLNQNHLEGLAPIARQHEAYVGPLIRNGVEVPGESALYVTFELLPGIDPVVLDRYIERGGFSIAFFSTGIGQGPRSSPCLELQIGLPAEAIKEIEDAQPLLDELSQALPDVAVEVRRYHEHELASTATLVFVAGWVGGKVIDKLFDRVWTAFESEGLERWRKLVRRVKFSFNTTKGSVHAVFPAHGTRADYERSLRAVVDEVIELECGTVRRRLSFTVTESWTLEKHSESLQPPE